MTEWKLGTAIHGINNNDLPKTDFKRVLECRLSEEKDQALLSSAVANPHDMFKGSRANDIDTQHTDDNRSMGHFGCVLQYGRGCEESYYFSI